MDENEKQELINDLKDLFKKLKSYKRYLTSRDLSEPQKRYAESLREKLVGKSSVLKGTIYELTDTLHFTHMGGNYEIWGQGLNPSGYKPTEIVGLNYCIDATNAAIAKLELSPPVELGPQKVEVTEPPKAFIAHGGRSGILDKLREFIEALGIAPIIVELSPSRGMTVDDKVNSYIKDADCGIVLATKGGIVDTKGTKQRQHPRLNVIDELERLRAAFPEKTILLVERGVDLPSNVSGLTHEPFVGQSMDRAFTAIARELVEFGILKAVKPQE
jgi:predicted nucleotide-binding protein